MVLVDTSVWIDYFRGIESPYTAALELMLDEERVATGDLIIAELLQGFKSAKDLVSAHEILNRLEYFDLVGRTVAYQAAENYRALRSRGVTVRKTVDMLIGTFCIEHKIILLHNDRDFDAMERFLGLKVVPVSAP